MDFFNQYFTGDYYLYTVKHSSVNSNGTVIDYINPYKFESRLIDDKTLIKLSIFDVKDYNLKDNEILLFKPSYTNYWPGGYYYSHNSDYVEFFKKYNFINFTNYEYILDRFGHENYIFNIGNSAGECALLFDINRITENMIIVLQDMQFNENHILNYDWFNTVRKNQIRLAWDMDYLIYFISLIKSRFNINTSLIPNEYYTKLFFDYRTTLEWRTYNNSINFSIDMRTVFNRMINDNHISEQILYDAINYYTNKAA